jgi:hypothetical protein
MAISKRKLIYPIFVTLVILGLMVIAVFYVQLKDLDTLRDLVVQEIRAETQRDMQIGSAQLDFTEGIGLQLGEVTLKGSSVQQSDFTCKKVLVLLRWLPLLKGEINIQKLIFEGLMVQITRDDQGAFNFGDLSVVEEASRSGATFPDLIRAGLLHNVLVRKSELWLVDHFISSGSKPLVTRIKNLSLAFNKHITKSSLRVHLAGDVPFTKQESGKVKLDGKMRVPEDLSNLSQMGLEGTLQVRNVGTEPFQPYLAKVFEQHPGEHLVTLDTQFSGTPDGHVRLSGSLKHTQREPLRQPGFSRKLSHVQGSLDYNFIFNQDTVEFKQLNYRSEDFLLMIKGTFARFLSDKARLTVTLKSAPFPVQNSADYLPFKIFSREIHNRLHKFLKRGEVEVASLNLEGPPDIFEGRSNAEIQEHDSGLIILRHVDIGMDALPIQNVSGELHFKKGVARVKVKEARFEHVLISNVSGTVTQSLTDPMIEGTLEAKGALAPLALLIEKKWTLPHRLAFLKDLKRIQGVGQGKLTVRGPLFENERLMWSGNVSLENAGFIKKGWSAPIKNIKGNIHFKSVTGSRGSAGKRNTEKTWALRFEKFNGEFGNNYFRDINGEVFSKNGVSVKTVHGKIQLGTLKAEQVISTPFEGRIKSFLKQILFESGEIDFNFQTTGPGWGKIKSQNRGSLKIKKLYLKHSKGFRSLQNLNATVLFDDHNIDLETTGGWYGDSPIELKGRFKNYSEAMPELVLTARSTDFLRQDFSGIPFLETLEYQGPATVDLKFHSTDRFVKLEKEVDLTRTSYRYKNFLIKPENVSNFIGISATQDSEGKIDFKKVTFELEGSKVIGKGFLKSMDDPRFSIQLGSDHFKTWPASQYIRPLQGSLGGNARFHISAQGNVRNLEEAMLQGSVHLKGIEYKPDHFLVPIKFNADLKFKNKHFQIQNGKLEAKGSEIFFSGDYQGGEAPHVKLKLEGPGLNLNQMVSEEGKPSKGFLNWLGETRVFSKGSGEIEIKLNRFVHKFWTLPGVTGKLTFEDQVLQTNNLNLGQPKIDEVMLMGKLSLADNLNPAFDVVLISRKVPVDNLFAMFGGMFKASLTGDTIWLKAHLQGRGGNLKQITQSLKGQLSFHFKDGRINTGRLLNGVVELFGISIDPKTVSERARQPNSSYMRIFGNFSILEGVARTENFMFEETGQRLSLVGAFDLNTSRMGTVVGVAPFRRVGRIIKQIPILGPIVTGGEEGSLITNYYKVEGPFSDPKVESIPLTSVSKKVLGTFQGIFSAPSDLFPKQDPASP